MPNRVAQCFLELKTALNFQTGCEHACTFLENDSLLDLKEEGDRIIIGHDPQIYLRRRACA